MNLRFSENSETEQTIAGKKQQVIDYRQFKKASAFSGRFHVAAVQI
jgi:hypothetical protein